MTTAVLVTGGAGYIASHVCKELARRGYVPVAYDNLGAGRASLVRWGPLEVGDVRDAARLDEVMETHRPTAVMHFAAHAYVGESVGDPGKYYRNNVGGSLALLDAMVRHRVDALVFSSTCAVFGVPDRVPIPEDHRRRPINPYGASKWMVERILADYEAAHGLRSMRLRYFNAAGADPDGETGEIHDPETHLIPRTLEVALGTREAVEVYGTDYPTRDGTCVRDYVHVSDLADAHVRALEHLAAGRPSATFNLGTGTGYSVLQVIDEARRTTGERIPAIARQPRVGDPPELVAAVGAAGSVLGWAPRRSDLATIMSHAWQWMTSRPLVARSEVGQQ